jgi:hypothetical protein
MQSPQFNLSVPMAVFTVFYAIAWGALANALPRLKAFDTGRFFSDRLARRRFFWSMLILNLAPVFNFAVWLAVFGGRSAWDMRGWGSSAFWLIFFAAVAALFAPFGIYRIWVCVVQWWAECFYPIALDDCEWGKQFPNLRKSDLSADQARSNFIFGVLFLLISWLIGLTGPYVLSNFK